MKPPTLACLEPPDPPPLTDECDVCIGPPAGCRVGFDGVHWCGRVRHHVPGYLIVGMSPSGRLCGYRVRRADDILDPATVARIEAFLAEHAAKCATERERRERAAAVVSAGLSAIPSAKLSDLIADAVAGSGPVADIRADISDMADAVVDLQRKRGAA